MIIAAVVWFVISPFVEKFIWGDTREITWQEVQRTFLDKGLVERFIVYAMVLVSTNPSTVGITLAKEEEPKEEGE